MTTHAEHPTDLNPSNEGAEHTAAISPTDNANAGVTSDAGNQSLRQPSTSIINVAWSPSARAGSKGTPTSSPVEELAPTPVPQDRVIEPAAAQEAPTTTRPRLSRRSLFGGIFAGVAVAGLGVAGITEALAPKPAPIVGNPVTPNTDKAPTPSQTPSTQASATESTSTSASASSEPSKQASSEAPSQSASKEQTPTPEATADSVQLKWAKQLDTMKPELLATQKPEDKALWWSYKNQASLPGFVQEWNTWNGGKSPSSLPDMINPNTTTPQQMAELLAIKRRFGLTATDLGQIDMNAVKKNAASIYLDMGRSEGVAYVALAQGIADKGSSTDAKTEGLLNVFPLGADAAISATPLASVQTPWGSYQGRTVTVKNAAGNVSTINAIFVQFTDATGKVGWDILAGDIANQ